MDTKEEQLVTATGPNQPIIPRFITLPATHLTSLIQILHDYPIPEWQELFHDHLASIVHIEKKILEIHPSYYPHPADVFNAFYYTPLSRVRVVIVGQDPYYTAGPGGQATAMGLAFSVRKHMPIPPSLDNVFNEIARDGAASKIPDHGDLSRWATQEGIMLLNTCLTVKPGEDKSHGKLWLPLIKPVLETIARERPKTLFLLWGKQAQQVKKFIGSCQALETSHPSPLGAHYGFIGCGHFAKTNQYLESIGERPIDWRVD